MLQQKTVHLFVFAISMAWVLGAIPGWPAGVCIAQIKPNELVKSANSNSGIIAAGSLADAAEAKDWDQVAGLIAGGSDLDQAQPDGMTALHWAVFHENTVVTRRLIKRGADVDAETIYRVRPLNIACQNGNAAIADCLLEHGADANHRLSGGETVLMTAARNGNRRIVADLIRHNAEIDAVERRGQTALMWAAAEGNLAVVEELIRANADLHVTLKSGFTAFFFAARQGKTDAARRLIDAGVDVNQIMHPQSTSGRNPRDGMSGLMLAVESGHFELALELIKLGADPNDQRSGFAPLHAISWVRRTKVGDNPDGDPPPRGSGALHSLQFVKKLIEAGADPNLQLKRGSGGRAVLNLKGATPILMASKTADVPLMKLLLEHGADPNLHTIDDCSPLLAAAGVGVLAVGEEPGSVSEVATAIKILLDSGNDINHVDQNGESVMHGAAYRNFPETVRLLCRLDADPRVWNQKNRYGWTPVMIAAGNRPGSLKPSPETIAALNESLSSQNSAVEGSIGPGDGQAPKTDPKILRK
jgi:ankyrin repeat protein